MSFADLRQLYAHVKVEVGTSKKGEPVFAPIAEVWLASPDRRTYAGGVVFDPAGRCGGDALNLWSGFAIKPAQGGTWDTLRGHVFENLCKGDQKKFDFLIRYMARMVQFPAEAAEVAIVIHSEQEGTGKGMLPKALMRLLGRHAMQVSNPTHLTGRFNAHLQDCVLLFADEAFYAGNPQHVGILKSLITEATLTIEPKFGRVITAKNCLHVFMCSNDKWVIPAGLHARRFFVLEAGTGRLNDHEFFVSLWKELENGGYEAMLHDLLAINLCGFNVRAVPQTVELAEQKKLSLDVPHRWWLDVLQRGWVFRSKLGLEEIFSEWMPMISTETLWSSYAEFSTAAREHHPMSREAFGRLMLRLGCAPRRLRNAIVGEHLADGGGGFGDRRTARVIKKDRACGYSLGTLSAARMAFEKATGVSFDWPDDSDDDTLEIAAAESEMDDQSWP